MACGIARFVYVQISTEETKSSRVFCLDAVACRVPVGENWLECTMIPGLSKLTLHLQVSWLDAISIAHRASEPPNSLDNSVAQTR